MHQFDLLYMPNDTLFRNKYSYILSGIDITSTYKVVRPLRKKWVKDIDSGSEFKAGVTKLLEKHGVTIWHATMKYSHTHKAFIEMLNKLLTEELFKVQDM